MKTTSVNFSPNFKFVRGTNFNEFLVISVIFVVFCIGTVLSNSATMNDLVAF